MPKYSSNLFILLKEIWGYLTSKRHFQLFGVLALMILSAAAEVFSLAAVIPFFKFFEPRNKSRGFKLLKYIYKNFPNIGFS